MQIVEIIVTVLMLFVAVFLVWAVLAQDAKSAGLGSAFGNDTTALARDRNVKVSREAKLRKYTVVLAIVLGVLALVLLVLPGIEALMK